MINLKAVIVGLTSFLLLYPTAPSQERPAQPTIRPYKTVENIQLKAHIFKPSDPAKGKLHPAIILLHGGGWVSGSPEWTYQDAQWYAGLGLVAIAGEYRLSDQKAVTPLEAMSDVRDLVRWTRQNATDLAIDPNRIVIFGISAGGHLAASAAVFPHTEESKTSSVPNALILLSPAASIVNDNWPQILLVKRAEVKDISPAENISVRLPPIFIAEGSADTETPLVGVKRFCDRAKEVGGTCDLHVYPGVGHILTRNLDPHAQEDGPFDMDPADNSDAHTQYKAFLVQLGYIK